MKSLDKGSPILQSATSPLLEIVHFRIRPGSDLLEAIEEGVKRHKITSGVFISGLGALKKAVFRNLREMPREFPVKPENRLYFEIEKPMELLSINGWIGQKSDGTPEIHAHFAASVVDNDKVVAFGGHLIKGTMTSIKVVVAIGVLPPGSVRAAIDDYSKSYDIDLS